MASQRINIIDLVILCLDRPIGVDGPVCFENVYNAPLGHVVYFPVEHRYFLIDKRANIADKCFIVGQILVYLRTDTHEMDIYMVQVHWTTPFCV